MHQEAKPLSATMHSAIGGSVYPTTPTHSLPHCRATARTTSAVTWWLRVNCGTRAVNIGVATRAIRSVSVCHSRMTTRTSPRHIIAPCRNAIGTARRTKTAKRHRRKRLQTTYVISNAISWVTFSPRRMWPQSNRT